MEQQPNPAPAAPVASPAPPPDTAPPTPPAEPVDPATLAVEVDRPGGRESMVPLAALKEERARVSQERTQRTALEQEIAQLKQQLGAVLPVFELVKGNPALLSQVQEGRVPTRTEPSQEDLEALEYAREYDLYDAQGQPDVARAKRMIARENQRIQRAIAPVAQMSQTQKSEANLAAALAQRDQQGRPYARPETIRELWQRMPPHLTADPNVVEVVLKVARGQDFEYLAGMPQAPSAPPIFSEAAGGHLPQQEGASEHEQRAMRDRGVSEKQWNEVINRPGGLWAPFKD